MLNTVELNTVEPQAPLSHQTGHGSVLVSATSVDTVATIKALRKHCNSDKRRESGWRSGWRYSLGQIAYLSPACREPASSGWPAANERSDCATLTPHGNAAVQPVHAVRIGTLTPLPAIAIIRISLVCQANKTTIFIAASHHASSPAFLVQHRPRRLCGHCA